MKRVLLLISMAGLHSALFAGTFYVSTTGNDNNPGTISLPWKTLFKAMTTVNNYDTVFVFQGNYYERSVILLNGKHNVLIKGVGNVSISGYFQEFQNPQQTQPWELWDASKGIYRSTMQYSTHPTDPLERDQVKGTFQYLNEEYRFVQRRGTYYSYSDLATDNQYWVDGSGHTYVGPGLYHDIEGNIDPANHSRIYVRLKPSRYMTAQDSAYSLLSVNPNNFSMNITYNFSNRIFFNDCHNYRIEGIKFYGYYFYLQDKCNDITLRNLTMHHGHIETSWQNANPSYNITIDSIHFTNGYFPWVTYQDIKTPPYRANSYEYAYIAIQGQINNLEIKNCTFEKSFFGILITHNSNTIHHLKIHDNKFEKIIDDCIFLASSCWEVDIYKNIMLGPATGVSRYGQGNSGNPGKVYIHHNIIDCSKNFLWGRSKSDGTYEPDFWGYNNTGLRWHWAFGYHQGTGFGQEGDPRNIYNNTCIVGPSGYISIGLYNIFPKNYQIRHKSYNNIFIQTHEEAIDGYSLFTDGSMLVDGNMYFRSHPFGNVEIIKKVNDITDYYDFVSYQTTTGFESNGIFSNPMLDSNYCPHSNDALGGINLAIAEPLWPMVSTTPYRGAIYPCFTTSTSDYNFNENSLLKAYPNPSTGKVTIETSFEGELSVFNCLGQHLQTTTITSGQNEILIEENGVYMIFLNDKLGNKTSTKVIINK